MDALISTNSSPQVIIPLLIGFFLDLLLGDPLWLPHPVRWFGHAICWLEKKLNCGNHRIAKGTFVSLGLTLLVWAGLYAGLNTLKPFPLISYPIASLLVFYGLANRTLIDEVIKVNRKLDREGLQAGREQLRFIVGRETTNLSENQIRIATLETLSENLSDGVIAPLFYYALGGLPAMFAYKMINTLDSMIGYKNERYKLFGCAAARTDDVLNFLPARITALLMVLVTLSKRGLLFIFRYGHRHSSPNSGYPEAALAGILDCRFGGSNIYHGLLVEKPFIGNNERKITPKDIKKAIGINMMVSVLTIMLIVAILLFI
jgi:adenosylcobinamide-phosphate synthase